MKITKKIIMASLFVMIATAANVGATEDFKKKSFFDQESDIVFGLDDVMHSVLQVQENLSKILPEGEVPQLQPTIADSSKLLSVISKNLTEIKGKTWCFAEGALIAGMTQSQRIAWASQNSELQSKVEAAQTQIQKLQQEKATQAKLTKQLQREKSGEAYTQKISVLEANLRDARIDQHKQQVIAIKLEDDNKEISKQNVQLSKQLAAANAANDTAAKNIVTLKKTITRGNEESNELRLQLSQEKSKVEQLQFQLEQFQQAQRACAMLSPAPGFVDKEVYELNMTQTKTDETQGQTKGDEGFEAFHVSFTSPDQK